MEEKKADIQIIRNFTRGKDDGQIYSIFSDVKKKNPLGESKLYISFRDDDELLSVLDLDGDDAWFARVVCNSYSNYDFIDSSQIEDDFKEGYIVYNVLDDDNKELLKQIYSIFGSSKNFDPESRTFLSNLSELLLNYFPDELDNILSDFHIEKEYQLQKGAQIVIEKEINDYCSSAGFKMENMFNEISTTPANLLFWYHRFGNYTLSVKKLLKLIFEEKNYKIGGWYEDQYQFENNGDFDSSSFNRTVERQFEKILEKTIEDEDIKDFISEYSEISGKFGIGKWNDLPKNPNFQFLIKKVDFENKKIIIALTSKKRQKGTVSIVTKSLSAENFKLFLYHPELFQDEIFVKVEK